MSAVSEPDEASRIEPLFTDEDLLDQEAALAIVREGERWVPRLRTILADPVLWEDEGPRGWAPVHAAFLLSEIAPEGILEDLVAALGRALERSIDPLLDAASSLLARAAGADPEPLGKILLDRSRKEFLRAESAAALLSMAAVHPELLEPALGLLRSVASDPTESLSLRLTVGWELLELGHPEDRELLLAFGNNEMFDLDYVNEVMDGGEPLPPFPPESPLAFYDPEAIARRLEGEDEFDRSGPTSDEDDEHSMEDLDPDQILPLDVAGDLVGSSAPDPDDPAAPPPGDPDAPPPPFRRPEAKVGRNDPCVCGSGKKWKKCCGR